MATRARSGADLASTINANTSAPSNTIVVSSSGNITTANDLSLSGHLVGYVSNTYLQATFAQNTAIVGLANDRLQVANAAATYLTKSVALTSNNSLVNLINDREQVANAAVSYVTKAVHLTSNNALINLINDRYQPANLASDLVSYWPSANIINYVASAGGGTTMQTNTSIFIATGGETEVAIPYSNTNHLSVKLNGVRLTPGEDYTSANNTHIGNMLALAAADVLTVTEYKQHTANVLNRSAGGGGGGGSLADGAQGESFGYVMGGDPQSPGKFNTVDKYSFTSDGNATDVGDLPVATSPYNGGTASATKGYSVGGTEPAITTNIYGFPFSSDSSISDVGDVHPEQGYNSTSSVSPSHSFISGGSGEPSFTKTSIISKFPFASEGTAADSGGDLSACTASHYNSVTSADYGYVIRTSPPYTAILEKFPFAISSGTSSTLPTTFTTLPSGHQGFSTHQSTTHGYYGNAGGSGSTPNNNSLIQKWDFASDTTVTCVGYLTTAHPYCSRFYIGGTSSTASGYSHGGSRGGFPPVSENIIDKFPFSSDADASDVGDLTVARRSTSSHVHV